MKTLTICALLVLSVSGICQPLSVHEWGTFTSLHGSEGSTLSGLYFEEEQLPPFVYHFPGFSPDAGTRTCTHVLVKMETPVLYFYSSIARQVHVHVDFPMGAITQWYPNRSGGEAMADGVLDLGSGTRGSIDWNASVLSPLTPAQPTQTTAAAGYHKWTDPRMTDANLIKNDSGEIEKYLFYRGLANIEMPVGAYFIDSVHLSVTNTLKFDIPFIYIYDHTVSQTAVIWGIGPLKAGETKIFTPGHSYNDDSYIREKDSFRIALQTAGLMDKEAAAMLNTWEDGYFQTLGFKVFWIVPRAFTDQILPITITPNPDTLVRVLVGKTEVLTPRFERQLLADYRAGKMGQYASDRYHVAYLQRAQELDYEYPLSHPLTVHQWGTFTSLHSSHGATLSGLYMDEEQLPPFVYHFPGFSPDTAIALSGYYPCKNVTVKLETPVLYFYSDIERHLQINLNLPDGFISGWYPNRSGGDLPPSGDSLDLGVAHRGMIAWDATVLTNDTGTHLPISASTPNWEAARQTDANFVMNTDGEVEKYLFFTGIANFSLPLEFYFSDSTQLIMRNNSASDISFMYIYDHMINNGVRIWGIGPIRSQETKVFNVPGSYYFYDDNTSFQKALVVAGLNDKEAQALINTCANGYFQTTGFKVFWIMPRKITDQSLPLTMNPTPDTLERVMVGKTEILTIPFEKELLDYYTLHGNLDKWKNHPYYLAYLERVRELYKPVVNAGVSEEASSNGFTIIPNPGEAKIQIFGTSAHPLVTIRNMLGEIILRSSQTDIDIHDLTRGIYFLSARDGTKLQTIKLVKK